MLLSLIKEQVKAGTTDGLHALVQMSQVLVRTCS
jgi:hypothetical protein